MLKGRGENEENTPCIYCLFFLNKEAKKEDDLGYIKKQFLEYSLLGFLM